MQNAEHEARIRAVLPTWYGSGDALSDAQLDHARELEASFYGAIDQQLEDPESFAIQEWSQLRTPEVAAVVIDMLEGTIGAALDDGDIESRLALDDLISAQEALARYTIEKLDRRDAYNAERAAEVAGMEQIHQGDTVCITGQAIAEARAFGDDYGFTVHDRFLVTDVDDDDVTLADGSIWMAESLIVVKRAGAEG